MSPSERAALVRVVDELTARANARARPADPVSIEAVQLLALAGCARALQGLVETLDGLGTVRTPRAEAARNALRNLARTR